MKETKLCPFCGTKDKIKLNTYCKLLCTAKYKLK